MEEARTHRPLPSGSSSGASIPLLHSPTYVSTETREGGKERQSSHQARPRQDCLYTQGGGEGGVQVEVREEARQAIQSLRLIYHSHHHRHPVRSHSSQKRDRSTTSNRKTDFEGEEQSEGCVRGGRRVRTDSKEKGLQGEMGFRFQLGRTCSHACSDLLATQTASVQGPNAFLCTLTCGWVTLTLYHSSSRQCQPVKPDSVHSKTSAVRRSASARPTSTRPKHNQDRSTESEWCRALKSQQCRQLKHVQTVFLVKYLNWWCSWFRENQWCTVSQWFKSKTKTRN